MLIEMKALAFWDHIPLFSVLQYSELLLPTAIFNLFWLCGQKWCPPGCLLQYTTSACVPCLYSGEKPWTPLWMISGIHGFSQPSSWSPCLIYKARAGLCEAIGTSSRGPKSFYFTQLLVPPAWSGRDGWCVLYQCSCIGNFNWLCIYSDIDTEIKWWWLNSSPHLVQSKHSQKQRD